MSSWPAVQATLFVLATGVLLYLSRRPLLAPGSHGFYRFFAWEAIVALVVLNLPVWFRHPLAPAQLASWLLLVGSIYPVVAALRLFRAVGHARAPATPVPAGAREDPANYAFENTSQLVQVGIYRFIRHPMYASLLYLAWGVYLKRPASLAGIALALAASIFLWLTALADEEECTRVFGSEYTVYMSRTRRFVPYLF